MKITKNINGDSLYDLETLDDFDEYEKMFNINKETKPNFYILKNEFQEYKGKIWQDRSNLRYTFNGVPVYVEYKIIALESDPWDWYWVVQNVDDDRDIKFISGCISIKNDIK